MIKKTAPVPSFAEATLLRRLDPSHWLFRLRDAIDWTPLEKRLAALYAPSGPGRPAYPPLALFRVLLLQRWYHLSDPGVVEHLSCNLRFMAFVGLSLESDLPDDTTLVVFRRRLSEAGLDKWAFGHFEKALEAKGLTVKEGSLVDATMVQAAVRPGARRRDGDPQDEDARWGRKSQRAKGVFGYKAHAAVDKGSLLIREVAVTAANAHDSRMLAAVSREEERAVWADKAYGSKDARERFRNRGVAANLLFRAARGTPLEEGQVNLNKIWVRARAPVEGAFASMKRWCGMPRIRYLGMRGARLQVYFAALAHNLKRMTKLQEARAEVCA